MNGKSEIIDAVYREFYNTVYRYCLANLSYHRQDAENVTQTVFMIFIEKHHKVHPEKYKSWLLSTADREIKNFKRKNKGAVNLDDCSEALAESDADILEEIIRRELLKQESEIERQILSSLKPAQRQLLEDLKSGLTTAEVAQKAGMDRRKVTVQIYYLKKRIRELTERQKEKII